MKGLYIVSHIHSEQDNTEMLFLTHSGKLYCTAWRECSHKIHGLSWRKVELDSLRELCKIHKMQHTGCFELDITEEALTDLFIRN